MTNQTCGNCRFYQGGSAVLTGGKGRGLCLRYPPQVFPVQGPTGMGTMSTPTPTQEDQWCGEWKPAMPVDMSKIGGN